MAAFATTSAPSIALRSTSDISRASRVAVAKPTTLNASFKKALPAQLTASRVGQTADRRSLSVRATAAASVGAAPQPLYPRVVPEKLPKLYVYDHCPFCVRVRVALGIKNVKHEVVFMANDDVATPTALVGKKIAPIIELPDGTVMAESMDIIDVIDGDAKYGPTGAIAPKSGRKDISGWQKEVKELLRLLHRPRYMMAALPEFQQRDSRDYFVGGHPVPPYDKPEWKSDDFPMEKKVEAYKGAYAQSDELIPQINEALKKLDDMIDSPEACNPEGGVSMDDIDLWARLRSVTIIDGLEMPIKMRAYMDYFAEVADCPLYFCMKC
mmetsp:Transcript_40727/g.49406  ORF Transcript_40727/g.49406 Transcript_40727/m.49406 type:complete len:325 (+) Transcript_40727:74-1048(+)|eukprot:CAMPEP_0197848952 /NCGR_PEP_ID=MMETSP1438-20131217/10558_1 /TAXON_ID=1461541 /ORGANISM="Pterosperma sp., Strain CCMP1384" /LENGTH=324 /DNA_ID=CAMNT_0043461435 /DNA_START=61 /DNA_END=1035 /DNA_ORIENTATION=-